MQNIVAMLLAEQDAAYRDFNAALLPTLPKERQIGVRLPVLRRLAKEIAADPELRLAFMARLPHYYLEENTLHAFLLMQEKDWPRLLAELERFLPYIDNWATCDALRPRRFEGRQAELLPRVRRWLNSDHAYTVRFGLNTLQNFYLGDAFSPELTALAAAVAHEDYYVKMAAAWYFATALAKRYDAVLPYIEQGRLDVWTHNKTIQKAIESRRLTPEQKAYLRTLKRPNK